MTLSTDLKEFGRARIEAWTELPLLAGVARGDLPMETFRYYLQQDYIYLRAYTRLYSRLAGNAPDEYVEPLVLLAANLINVELDNHRRLGESFGASFDNLTPSAECRNYMAFLREASSDFGEGLVAALPCLWGYGVALSLVPRENSGPYRPWLDVYSSDAYAAMIDRFCAMIDETDVDQARARELFGAAIDFEDAFWSQQPPASKAA
jgi:thiaminase/transcriptional activator TenA